MKKAARATYRKLVETVGDLASGRLGKIKVTGQMQEVLDENPSREIG